MSLWFIPTDWILEFGKGTQEKWQPQILLTHLPVNVICCLIISMAILRYGTIFADVRTCFVTLITMFGVYKILSYSWSLVSQSGASNVFRNPCDMWWQSGLCTPLSKSWGSCVCHLCWTFIQLRWDTTHNQTKHSNEYDKIEITANIHIYH
jgi:hypothetical protein